jgi:hypothetical protein
MSEVNTLNDKLNFGKYKGRTIKEIRETDPGYLCWLRDSILKDKRQIFLADDINESLDKWLLKPEGQRRSKGQFINWTANPPDLVAMKKAAQVQIEHAAEETTTALHMQEQVVAFAGYGDEWGAF